MKTPSLTPDPGKEPMRGVPCVVSTVDDSVSRKFNVLLSVVRELTPFAMRASTAENQYGDKIEIDGASATAAHVTLMNAFERMDTIIKSDALWQTPVDINDNMVKQAEANRLAAESKQEAAQFQRRTSVLLDAKIGQRGDHFIAYLTDSHGDVAILTEGSSAIEALDKLDAILDNRK